MNGFMFSGRPTGDGGGGNNQSKEQLTIISGSVRLRAQFASPVGRPLNAVSCRISFAMHNRRNIRMVLAYHVIFGTYGFWLPNDPRGSWSDFVRSWELLRYGPATHVHTRRSTAYDPHDQALRQQ